ncbi:MAG: DNA double-strand break repair nuclease NurA [Candidatus Bathyarchaeota archaeon]|nr:MAG: DNA double-strand break repair nuclease NurA [Candidatus Bathyarchaeota archaeon]
MIVDAMKKLVNKLDDNIKGRSIGHPFFSHPAYKTFPLSQENFKHVKPVERRRRYMFVDGGNQEILGAPNFSIQFNRIYFNSFESQHRVLGNSMPNRVEFLSATHSRFQEGEIFYDTSIFPLENHRDLLPDEADLSFNSFDRTVTIGTQRADIQRVASIARGFAEWDYAFHVVEKEMKEGNVLVMDGTLQTGFTNESKYAHKVYDAAKQKGVVVTGLSKTSHLFTTTGLSLLGAINKLAEDCEIYESWYIPVAEVATTDHNAAIFVVKLHPLSKHTFRFEILQDQFKQVGEEGMNEILSQLVENSKDVSFPGYPYGLVDADRFARVSNNEVESYRAILLSEISKTGNWPKFLRHVSATDAHTILNMLMG